jgi:hypothetical protein
MILHFPHINFYVEWFRTSLMRHPSRFLFLAVYLFCIPCSAYAQSFFNSAGCPPMENRKSSIFETRLTYLWGFQDIKFRDGDNGLIPPSKRVIQLDSPMIGLSAGFFGSKDLAFRVQGWANIPVERRNEFLFTDGAPQTAAIPRYFAWDTQPRYLEADVSLIYLFGLGNMPYAAGILAGYKYKDFRYESRRVLPNTGTFNDYFHIHVPYTGIYYANTTLGGSFMRMELIYSPFTLARLDSVENIGGYSTFVDGNSMLGTNVQVLWTWSIRPSGSLLVGAFGAYDFLLLAGQAKVQAGARSTRFSMDTRQNVFILGIEATYNF